ncbi:MAG: sulfatase-like hydrolase/transferase [Planctomycetota bacterium]
MNRLCKLSALFASGCRVLRTKPAACLVLVLALAITCFADTTRSGDASNDRPNIIVFLTDDQDKMSLGPYGGQSLTPEIDRMAREGMVFTNAHVTSTVCTPSRYSFLTGRYASRCYHPDFLAECPEGDQAYPEFNVHLEGDRRNIGAVLQAAGYRTGFVGKYHVGGFAVDHDGPPVVIAKNAPDNAETTELFRVQELRLREGLKSLGFDWAKNIYGGNLKSPYKSHNLEWTIDAALEFIEDAAGQPFYLHLCTTLTHGPDGSWSDSIAKPLVTGSGRIDAPIQPKGMASRQRILAELADAGLDPKKGHAGYRWVDAGVGAIFETLKRLDIDRNTIVIFTSDHGSEQKGSLFNRDGSCVPFIMHWPDGIKAGARCEALVQSTDIVATAVELAGATLPEGYRLDGRSLAPLFDGDSPVGWREFVYTEMGSGRAVQTPEWKYVTTRYTTDRIAEIRRADPAKLSVLCAPFKRNGIGIRGAKNANFYSEDQLYHLDEDPAERVNLADSPEHADRLELMRGLLTQQLRDLARPYGEFIPGGNAAPPGQVDPQLVVAREIAAGRMTGLVEGQSAKGRKNNKSRQRNRKKPSMEVQG